MVKNATYISKNTVDCAHTTQIVFPTYFLTYTIDVCEKPNQGHVGFRICNTVSVGVHNVQIVEGTVDRDKF